MADDDLRVQRGLVIPAAELQWRFTRSGGPGGQHANTADTRVELRFDIGGSPTLTEAQRRRLLDRLGHEVRVTASDERSQARNRDLARRRLADRLRDGLHRDRPRQATRPTLGSKRRRLDAKRRQGDKKQQRRRPRADD